MQDLWGDHAGVLSSRTFGPESRVCPVCIPKAEDIFVTVDGNFQHHLLQRHFAMLRRYHVQGLVCQAAKRALMIFDASRSDSGKSFVGSRWSSFSFWLHWHVSQAGCWWEGTGCMFFLEESQEKSWLGSTQRPIINEIWIELIHAAKDVIARQ